MTIRRTDTPLLNDLMERGAFKVSGAAPTHLSPTQRQIPRDRVEDDIRAEAWATGFDEGYQQGYARAVEESYPELGELE